MKTRIKKLIFLSLLFSFVLSLAACSANSTSNKPSDPNQAVDPKPNQDKITFTLYFGDNQAMYLRGEQRTVTKSGDTAELMVNELIKGPQAKDAIVTIPKETKLLSLEITGGIAYVNFSKEIKTNHWGGSAGETMTVYSVVNTLTQLPEIKKVQFLIEGQKQEAIWGHFYTLEPIGPNPNLIADQTGQTGSSNNEDQVKPGDYFPLNQGSSWQYLGDGNEYASFSREVLYVQGNKSQIKEDNGGTVSTSVYQITDTAVTQIYFAGEDYIAGNILNQPGNRNITVIKAPIQAGTEWTAGNATREIVDVKATVNTPAGNFDNCVQVKITENQSTSYEYYKKGIGLVKREFISGNDKISSILASYSLK
ncbi:GerMN domain-containing protein [Dehalobacter sp. DCM]|uniref:GerMN domain-containing protein n=1 Tax=Dehalobacter sp. DCM TaxID=2907827 RepID=UPI0030817698|nr:GerMN domain-containing protein [Dehalobacter sp. DCM]